MSNFVLDEWFDAFQTTGRFDYLDAVTASPRMSTGGYIIRDLSNGQISAAWGNKDAEAMHALRKPGHPAARMSMRLAARGQH